MLTLVVREKPACVAGDAAAVGNNKQSDKFAEHVEMVAGHAGLAQLSQQKKLLQWRQAVLTALCFNSSAPC